MASYYVYSGAAGAGTGANWANAYTTLTAAVSGKAAGDVFYIAHDHAESTGSTVTINSPGNTASPCLFLCVNRAGSVPPVSADLRTTATVTTTGGSEIKLEGSHSRWYGVIFSAATGAVSAGIVISNSGTQYENCRFKLAATGGAPISVPTGTAVWENCDVEFNATSQSISVGVARLRWQGGSLINTVIPDKLFTFSNMGYDVFAEGIDLSAAGSGKRVVDESGNTGRVLLKDCRLGSSVDLSVASNNLVQIVDFIRCDSGATNYRSERYLGLGTLTTETTIVRTGGASDGTTPIAWKIVTTSRAEWVVPFECFPISIWNETTGSAITVTVEGVWGGGAVPLNDEIWMDVEYLGNASYPIGSTATTTKADILATGANTTSSSETWGGSTTKFKMVASVTPQMKGPITVYVKVAKASSNVLD